MKPSYLISALLAVVALLPFTLSAQAYEVEEKERYSRSELNEEQRVVEAYLRTAEADIDRAVARVNANLTQTARISLLRARNFLSLAEILLNGQPTRIEQLAWGFYSRERVRQEFRDKFDELRNRFYYLEEQTVTLGREIDEKTGSGGEVSRALELISAVTKALPNVRDEQTREELEGILKRLSSALEANDEATANRILGELETFIAENQDEIPINIAPAQGDDSGAAISIVPGQRPAPSGPTGPQPGPAPSAPSKVESFTDPATGAQGTRETTTRTLPDGSEVTTTTETLQMPDGSTVETVTEETVRPDGSRSVVVTTTKTNPDGSQEVGRVVEEYDAAGNLVSSNGTKERISPSGLRQAQGGYTIDGDRITIQGPDGKPRSFIRNENGQYKVIEVRYIGGEGFRLTGERELFYELQPMTSSGTVEFNTRVGKVREWNYEVAEVPDLREFTAESMSATFLFRDALQKSDFEITGWKVMTPEGETLAESGATDRVSVTFTEGGTYTFIVDGTTDWGSAFKVREQVAIDL